MKSSFRKVCFFNFTGQKLIIVRQVVLRHVLSFYCDKSTSHTLSRRTDHTASLNRLITSPTLDCDILSWHPDVIWRRILWLRNFGLRFKKQDRKIYYAWKLLSLVFCWPMVLAGEIYSATHLIKYTRVFVSEIRLDEDTDFHSLRIIFELNIKDYFFDVVTFNV